MQVLDLKIEKWIWKMKWKSGFENEVEIGS